MAATVDAPTPSEHAADDGFSMPARVILAVFSLCAGVVHLVMVPSHAQDSAIMGFGFAVFGWLQVLSAVVLIARPSKKLLEAVIALNVAALAAWLLSRTAGLPFGAHAGEAEEITGIDALTAGFEGAVVVGSGLLIARPRLGAKLTDMSLAVMAVIPIIALVATSFALADPATVNHAHGAGEEAAGDHHGDTGVAHDTEMATVASQRCDLDINPAGYWNETTAAGIDNVMGGSHGSDSGDGHGAATSPAADVQGTPELDRLIATTTKEGGESKDAAVVVALANVTDETYRDWLSLLPTFSGSSAHTSSDAASGDDNHGMGGHLGPQPWEAMTDPVQCETLKGELALARSTAMEYPTAADATAAGWVRVTGYVPGIAAHYMNFGHVDGEFNIEEPEMLLYDGDGPDAAMVGLSYYVIHDSATEPTQGFTGPNDHFHKHEGLCVGAGGVIGDSTTTEEDCASRGGRKAAGAGGWMNHVWIVPGCESPWGMFSGATPLLEDELPKVSGTDGGGCAGSSVRHRYDLAPGAQTNTPTTVWGGNESAAGTGG